MAKNAPWYFRLASARIREGKRGGWALLRLFHKLGLLDRVCGFTLPNGEPILMPLSWPGVHDPDVFVNYEPDAIDFFAAMIETDSDPVILVDCGADVGVFGRLVLSKIDTARVRQIIAIEPNADSFEILRRNLSDLGIAATPILGAVSDHAGIGRLVSPAHDSGAHSKYIEEGGTADGVSIQTIDGLDIAGGGVVALKVDVEGAELAVLRGARATLGGAARFVVQFEAHPAVARRTGIDPIECLRFCAAIGPCRWRAFVEKTGQTYDSVTTDRLFFDQVPDDRIYDVVAASVPGGE